MEKLALVVGVSGLHPWLEWRAGLLEHSIEHHGGRDF